MDLKIKAIIISKDREIHIDETLKEEKLQSFNHWYGTVNTSHNILNTYQTDTRLSKYLIWYLTDTAATRSGEFSIKEIKITEHRTAESML